MRFEANQWTLARSGLALVALVSTLLSGAAVPVAAAGPAVVTTRDDARLGTLLADVRGVTLYMFTKDVTGISNCYDECAKAWPPVMTDGDAICSTTTIAALLLLGAQFPHRQFNSAELCILSGVGRTAMSQIKNARDTPFSTCAIAVS